jgi:hypothetical protein
MRVGFKPIKNAQLAALDPRIDVAFDLPQLTFVFPAASGFIIIVAPPEMPTRGCRRK